MIDRRQVEKFDIDVETAPPAADYADLVAAARRPGASIETVCNDLGVSPAELGRRVGEAQKAGVAVQVASGGVIGIRPAAPSEAPVEIAPIVGQSAVVGVMSDTHFGSKYCLRAPMRDYVKYAYTRGAREILFAGDLLDGCYRHGRWELSHHGVDEQIQDAIYTLPQLPGLKYHGICGNHDQTFVDSCGMEIGSYIERAFKDAGRADFFMHGNASAYLRVRGALIHLWHPKGGVPYALSYRLQKQVEAYSPGLKPDILLAGHLHKSVQLVTRGVHAFLVPCWQSGGSAFSNSLVGAPANGGLVLSWGLTEHGTLRSVVSEVVSYYHDESPRVLS
jgi:predicted phosphodiesterase